MSYVVVSTPRSGTGYISTVLTKLGLQCGHERYFNPWRHAYCQPIGEVFGDSSWLAAPYLAQLPPSTFVFHQIRDPIATINSNLHVGLFSQHAAWNLPYLRFALHHAHLESSLELPEIELTTLFWYRWHRIIEAALLGRPHIRYKVEDVSTDLIKRIANTLAHPNFSDEQIESVISLVSRNNNHRGGEVRSVVSRPALPTEVLQLAKSYGYYRDELSP